MNCELCGLSDTKFYTTELEGATMVLCQTCSKYGRVIGEVKDEKKSNFSKSMTISTVIERELKPGYQKLISDALTAENTSIDELAQRIKVSPQELRKIINGKLMPQESIAEKLEKALKISLFENVVTSYKNGGEENHLSFSDVVNLKHKNK
ncbi:MAG: multiprotein-bridging factor 1 family protein [Candidatus Parvarchaeota archaeon]|nr:multiprotein-bridging factor 1 family protein [Candidatus Parvarchaeota archaeon]